MNVTVKKYIKSILAFLFTVVGIVLGIFIGIKFLRFFMPFVIGWIIALIANPLVRFAESRMKIVRKYTSMLIIIVVLGLIVGAVYLAGSKVVEETAKLVEQAPDIYQSFSQDYKEVEKNLDRFILELPQGVQDSILDMQENIGAKIGEFASGFSQWTVAYAGDIAKHLPNVLIGIIFTILSAYFFIADRDKILEFGRDNTPMFIQRKWKVLADNFRGVIGGYFKAQFKIMAIIWIVLVVGFMFMRVKFAIFIAFLVAFLDMLPFFGTGTALIPWALFRILSGDMKMAVELTILYLFTQLLRRILEPKLVGDSIGIDPLATLVFMYAGYKMAGVLGMILAVPIGAIIINFYKMGVFDNMMRGCKEALEDFVQWLWPEQKKK
ncbi:sporulation integral membrane protein YtvI [Lactonifactor longoviformis]|uniref:sporulation integral membrane protein YtvI n=1 Tax=Lactonifactor longoviformis TaxID=341220 RepID=UPI001D0233BC|nr:sporulation integral membrane protein YtvI [Lactonifactor longoviformis]MCB5711459.1 sporulation integral membrane protein YtvI [Lactonifactor longoviformis]MCB5715426.1 sporulation integral membrane protein YtvI [Lactonifactor longoviformis]